MLFFSTLSAIVIIRILNNLGDCYRGLTRIHFDHLTLSGSKMRHAALSHMPHTEKTFAALAFAVTSSQLDQSLEDTGFVRYHDIYIATGIQKMQAADSKI